MNILTTQGLVARFVSDWAGPGAVIRRTAIRLGASNYPGDTMAMSGEVLSRQPAAGGEDIPPAWLEQLAPGGRLVAPLQQAGGTQALLVCDRLADGRVQRRLHEAVRFVPLKSGVD